MFRRLKWVYHWLAQFGFQALPFLRAWRGLPVFAAHYFRFRRAWRKQGRGFAWGRLTPCLGDRYDRSGEARGHYFHQDLWAAQRIFQNQPKKHLDIGSRVDGFVAHVAAFRELEVADIRPQTAQIKNIKFLQLDIMAPDLPPAYCDSISCLSVLEHFGLGRYGDPLEVDGHLRGWENIHRLLQPGGKLYFSVPIGPQRVEFDAHRVFSLPYLAGLMSGKYRVDAFAYVDDAGELKTPVGRDAAADQHNHGCEFGCGLFELTKLG